MHGSPQVLDARVASSCRVLSRPFPSLPFPSRHLTTRRTGFLPVWDSERCINRTARHSALIIYREPTCRRYSRSFSRPEETTLKLDINRGLRAGTQFPGSASPPKSFGNTGRILMSANTAVARFLTDRFSPFFSFFFYISFSLPLIFPTRHNSIIPRAFSGRNARYRYHVT